MPNKEFIKGFTIFHVIGIFLLFTGVLLPAAVGSAQWGELTIEGNIMSLTGAASFFIEIIKARIGKHEK